MARTKLTPEEAEKRKLDRRAAKKAKRKLEKVGVEVVETTTKGKASKNPFKLIEVATSDSVQCKKIGELKEAGISVKQIAYADGSIIYEVPSTVTGFSNYTTVVSKEKPVAEKPMKTLADLTVRVESDKADNVKMNKRYIKLLVRGSALKRNEKADAVTALIKKFKIK